MTGTDELSTEPERPSNNEVHMKKKSSKKLQLRMETVREVTQQDLDQAQGAGNTVWCTEVCSLISCVVC